jgi:hypothetical protein
MIPWHPLFQAIPSRDPTKNKRQVNGLRGKVFGRNAISGPFWICFAAAISSAIDALAAAAAVIQDNILALCPLG